MPARSIVFQCGACRSLVSVQTAVPDKLKDRAGLSCDICGGVTWLPFAAAGSARVVDVAAPGADADAPLRLAASTALAPMTATALATSSFSDDQRERIGERLQKLGAAGPGQEDLSTSFERLLGHWQSDAEHKLFLQKASLVGELAFAGQRYRAILDVVVDDPQAKKAQNDLLGLAMASLSREKDLGASGGAGGMNKNLAAVALLVVTVLVCAGILIYLPRFLQPDAENESMDVVPAAPIGDAAEAARR